MALAVPDPLSLAVSQGRGQRVRPDTRDDPGGICPGRLKTGSADTRLPSLRRGVTRAVLSSKEDIGTGLRGGARGRG